MYDADAVAIMAESHKVSRRKKEYIDFFTRFDTASIKVARVNALPLVMACLSTAVGIGGYQESQL